MKEAPSPGFLRSAAGERRRWPVALARAAVTASILAALIGFLPTEQIFEALGRAGPWTLGLIVVGLLGGHCFAAMKWRGLLRTAGFPCRKVEALRAHGAGLFANLWLPSLVGGDVVRAGFLARGRDGAGALAVGSVADRLIDTAALLILAGLGALSVQGSLPDAAAPALAIAGIALLGAAAAGPLVLRFLEPEQLPRRLASIARPLATSLDALFARPAASLAALLLSLAIQGAFVWLNVGLGRAVGIELPIAVWLLAWPLAKLIALVPISLGGLGVREGALAALLLPFAVEPALAVAQSLLWQASLLVAGLLAGGAAFGSARWARSGDRPSVEGAL